MTEKTIEEPVEETEPSYVMSEAEKEHYQEIIRLNDQVREAHYQHDIAKSHAKACKEELDLCSLKLSNLIADGPKVPDPQKELPFSDDYWQDVSIKDVLTLTEKQVEKLAEAGITNMGRLEFVRGGSDPDYPRGLRSIKGFGEKTIDALENDIIEWMSKNARQAEPVE